MNNSKNSVRTLTMLALLVAMSRAIAVRVRTEIFEWLFISTVLLFFRNSREGRMKRPPL